ncbi:MAG: DUF488 family protein [Microthrixaceae bacterium]|nr:DUF488 family protein [Microthrixaceae bacterium]
MVQFRIKRVYEPAAQDDGVRVLVDRLWPRGLTKERAAVDIWAKEAAPSTELRKRFHGGGESWEQFVTDYQAELQENPAVVELARQIANEPVVTLMFSVHNTEQNHAPLLQAALERALH